MAILAGLVICLVLAGVVVGVLDFFSEPKREIRADKKRGNSLLITRTKQLALAQSALSKIAADDSGNPRLDAQIALGEISATEIKELES